MSIYIFSRPVHTGKTTELQHWCDNQKNVSGILMPVIEGKRKVLDLVTNEIFDIECADPAITKEELIQAGPYYFYVAIFKIINERLKETVMHCPKWLVIDEVGKLELMSKGFYDAVKKIIEEHETKNTTTDLLLVVRDSLCEAVISFFSIGTHAIIHSLEDIQTGMPPTHGSQE